MTYSKKRSSSLKVFHKKDVLKSFRNFTRKHLHGSLFLLQHRCFPVKFAKLLRTAITTTNLGVLIWYQMFFQFIFSFKESITYVTPKLLPFSVFKWFLWKINVFNFETLITKSQSWIYFKRNFQSHIQNPFKHLRRNYLQN